tara:strand:+ start:2281 stop:2658 length:378 start_codon:yes stop_codon:yes gene_type:complete
MKKSSEKSFGILFGIIFMLIAFWPLFYSKDIQLWSLVVASIFLIFAFIKPNLLKKPNNLWIKFGEILGFIIAPIVMALIYFLILTPISLLLRVSGKDLLNLKYEKKLKSYWVSRKKNIGKMNRQF